MDRIRSLLHYKASRLRPFRVRKDYKSSDSFIVQSSAFLMAMVMLSATTATITVVVVMFSTTAFLGVVPVAVVATAATTIVCVGHSFQLFGGDRFYSFDPTGKV